MTISISGRNGGSALTYAVASEAPGQAAELEAEAADLEQRAAAKRRAAATLRAMHAIASLEVPLVALIGDEVAV
jgi:hypothetical protein